MKTVLVALLRAYRFLISPLYGQVCRYYPTCSAYALEAVQMHGAWHGSWLAARRVCRCHPWADGGVDHVPPTRASAPSATMNSRPSVVAQHQENTQWAL